MGVVLKLVLRHLRVRVAMSYWCPVRALHAKKEETNMDAFEVSDLTADELVRLIAAAKRALYPEAVMVGGELECVSCHIRGTPALIEDGMIVTHDLRELSDKSILARGWDGSSSDVSDVSEEGGTPAAGVLTLLPMAPNSRIC